MSEFRFIRYMEDYDVARSGTPVRVPDGSGLAPVSRDVRVAVRRR